MILLLVQDDTPYLLRVQALDFLAACEAGTPDLAPASLRPNPGLVHVAAATANLDSKGQPTQPYFGKELDYSKQQFAGNQADANEAAPAVGIPKSGQRQKRIVYTWLVAVHTILW